MTGVNLLSRLPRMDSPPDGAAGASSTSPRAADAAEVPTRSRRRAAINTRYVDEAEADEPSSPSPTHKRQRKPTLLHGKRQKLSAFRGVSRNKGRWVGQIVCDKKLRYLGLFDNEEDAARAFDRAAIRLRGRDADTNFPAEEYDDELEALDAGVSLEADNALCARRRAKASRFRGVCVSGGKFVAQITVDNVHHYLGIYNTEQEAAQAYDRAALRLRGDSAATNFPVGNYKAGGGRGSSTAAAAAQLRRQEQEEQEEAEAVGPAVSKKAANVRGQGTSSRFRGVTWNRGRWVAQLIVNKKYNYLGCYSDEVEAAHAYDRAALALLQGAAQTNFPVSHYTVDGSDNPATVPALDASRDRANKRGASSRYHGVAKAKGAKWVAQLQSGSLHKYLGCFDSEEAAARAYDLAALQLHGPEAPTNFPLSDYAPPPQDHPDPAAHRYAHAVYPPQQQQQAGYEDGGGAGAAALDGFQELDQDYQQRRGGALESWPQPTEPSDSQGGSGLTSHPSAGLGAGGGPYGGEPHSTRSLPPLSYHPWSGGGLDEFQEQLRAREIGLGGLYHSHSAPSGAHLQQLLPFSTQHSVMPMEDSLAQAYASATYLAAGLEPGPPFQLDHTPHLQRQHSLQLLTQLGYASTETLQAQVLGRPLQSWDSDQQQLQLGLSHRQLEQHALQLGPPQQAPPEADLIARLMSARFPHEQEAVAGGGSATGLGLPTAAAELPSGSTLGGGAFLMDLRSSRNSSRSHHTPPSLASYGGQESPSSVELALRDIAASGHHRFCRPSDLPATTDASTRHSSLVSLDGGDGDNVQPVFGQQSDRGLGLCHSDSTSPLDLEQASQGAYGLSLGGPGLTSGTMSVGSMLPRSNDAMGGWSPVVSALNSGLMGVEEQGVYEAAVALQSSIMCDQQQPLIRADVDSGRGSLLDAHNMQRELPLNAGACWHDEGMEDFGLWAN